jgi:DNA-binding transcriptional ArsR family regulator
MYKSSHHTSQSVMGGGRVSSLHPTVWRTCRVIANEIRLKLLWRLFEFGEGSMGQLARSVGIAESTASTGLRALNARGLIVSERSGAYTFYKIGANPEVEHAELLLDALRDGYRQVVPIAQVMRVSTAFTHSRRIDIVRALNDGGLDEISLSARCQISIPALQRHIRKLNDRGFVERSGRCMELIVPDDCLSQSFLKAALGS